MVIIGIISEPLGVRPITLIEVIPRELRAYNPQRHRRQGGCMTLAEELRRKYALTSFKTSNTSMPLLAINEALEAAADIADQEQVPIVASRIRSLKWTERAMPPISVTQPVSLMQPA